MRIAIHFAIFTFARKISMKYPIIMEDGGDGWITVYCPTFRGCISQGRTREEALINIKEALELTLEVYEESGWDIPRPAFHTELAEVVV
jgi:predicted RNase H-like HicB family nuclease